MLFVPTIIWDGSVWITTYVEVADATTGKPISGAVVSLRTEFAEVRSRAVITTQTDARGRATLKEIFSAGGDQSGTGAYVGTSSVHCDAAGYRPADIRISESGTLRFRKFLFYEQSHSATVRLSLQRQ
jgi:hypothetical protein